MPISTGNVRYLVAKASAMSWDLSPSSATKMTPKLITSAARNPSMMSFPDQAGGRCGDALDPAATAWVEGLARLAERGRVAGRVTRQYVDHDVMGYSPSLRPA